MSYRPIYTFELCYLYSKLGKYIHSFLSLLTQSRAELVTFCRWHSPSYHRGNHCPSSVDRCSRAAQHWTRPAGNATLMPLCSNSRWWRRLWLAPGRQRRPWAVVPDRRRVIRRRHETDPVRSLNSRRVVRWPAALSNRVLRRCHRHFEKLCRESAKCCPGPQTRRCRRRETPSHCPTPPSVSPSRRALAALASVTFSTNLIFLALLHCAHFEVALSTDSTHRNNLAQVNRNRSDCSSRFQLQLALWNMYIHVYLVSASIWCLSLSECLFVAFHLIGTNKRCYAGCGAAGAAGVAAHNVTASQFSSWAQRCANWWLECTCLLPV